MRHPSVGTQMHIIAILALVIAVTAHAPGAGAQGNEEIVAIFEALDDDGDGQIDPAEFEFKKIRVMNARDRDGDGNLSRDEVLISEERFVSVDTNNDGFVSGLEFIDGGLGQFETLDENGDRVIDLDELETWIMATN